MRRRDTTSSDRKRLWSDGHGVHHIATIGERVFAGCFDWAVVLFLGTLLATVVTYIYRVVVTWGIPQFDVEGESTSVGFFLFWPAFFVFVTLAHVVIGFMVAWRSKSPGYGALTLAVRRGDGERIGLKRALVRQAIGSPLLTIPLLTVVAHVFMFMLGDGTGSPSDRTIDSWESWVRELTSYWSRGVFNSLVVVPLLVVANHAWIVFDSKGRGLHDVAVDTVVVQERIIRTESVA